MSRLEIKPIQNSTKHLRNMPSLFSEFRERRRVFRSFHFRPFLMRTYLLFCGLYVTSWGRIALIKSWKPFDVVTVRCNKFTIFRVCDMSHFGNDLAVLSLVTVPQRIAKSDVSKANCHLILWNLKDWLTKVCIGQGEITPSVFIVFKFCEHREEIFRCFRLWRQILWNWMVLRMDH